MTRLPESLPDTGTVDLDAPDEAAKIVDDVAAHATARMLIALDVDGTVILEDESLSPGIVDAVAQAQRAGHEVMLATGRSWEGTRGILAALDIEPEYVVCSNGAVVMRRTDGGLAAYERFHTETFDPAEVLGLLRAHVPDAHYMVELADGRRRYTDAMDDWNLTNAQQVSFDQLGVEPVSRVVVVSPGQTEQDFVDLVHRIGLNQVSYAIGWTAWLDIAPMGVDKASGLELVRGWLDIAGDRVLVIGDGRNDLGMFRWARANGGRAVAMAQGPQEVRDAADETTLSVIDGGVAAVLRRL
ncbi:HAD family hydrolase [Microbacterium sp.]|uniref:HAD family hydrolase n=1 Tax=Microbacterium sp. TaxID=51671 RepID=UPI003A914246